MAIQRLATFKSTGIVLGCDEDTGGIYTLDKNGVWEPLLVAAGAVASVFGRIGVVVATANDYDTSQIKSLAASNEILYSLAGAILGDADLKFDPVTDTLTTKHVTLGAGGNITFPDATVQSTAGGSGSIQTATVTLTSAQLKALHGTPVQLVAAPGAGKVIIPLGWTLQYKVGAIPYILPSGGNFIADLNSLIGFGGTLVRTAVGFIDQAASQVQYEMGNLTSNYAQATGADTAMVVKNDAADEWILGDGTVTVTVYYTVVTLQ